jgi:hypothetical protein
VRRDGPAASAQLAPRRQSRCRRDLNQRWSLDFASDAFSLATVADFRSWRLLTTSRASAWRSWPIRHCPGFGSSASSTPSSRFVADRSCISDNGTELTSMAILRWSRASGRMASNGVLACRRCQAQSGHLAGQALHRVKSRGRHSLSQEENARDKRRPARLCRR